MTLPGIAGLLLVAAVTGGWSLVAAITPPTLPFGVRVPPERIADREIRMTRRRYRRDLLVTAITATIAVIPALLLIGPSIVLSAVPLILGLAGFGFYWRAHSHLRHVKARDDWYAGTRQVVVADTRLRTDPVRPAWRWWWPSPAILAVSAVIATIVYPDLPATLPNVDELTSSSAQRIDTTPLAAFSPVLLQAGFVLLVPLLVIGVCRSRPELDAARPNVSVRRWRTYLSGMTTILLLSGSAINLALLMVGLRLWEVLDDTAVIAGLSYLPVAGLVIALVVFEVRVGYGGHRLLPRPDEEAEDIAEDDGSVQRDDDRYWHLGGFLYLNRDDPAILVHQRAVGGSWTLNLGHPIVWLLLLAATVIGGVAVV